MAVATVAALGALSVAQGAWAGPVTVVGASGGGALSADSAAAGGSGAFTALTGPVLSESAAGGIGVGTIVLSAPAGFEFQAGQGSCAATSGGIAVAFAGATSSSVTCVVTAVSGTASTVRFSGIRVRPTAGVPLAGGGIARSGTAVFSDGGAGYGTLAEVAGLAAQLSITGPASVVAGDGNQLTVTAKDRFGNTANSYAGVKQLVFSGDPGAKWLTNIALYGTPWVSNNVSVGIPYGNPTAITFAAGVSRAGGQFGFALAEVEIVCATDGAISASGGGCLTVSVRPGLFNFQTRTEPVASSRGRLAVQPVMSIQDGFGNLPSLPGTVTASLRAGNAAAAASGATLSGTLTVPLVDGWAVFTDLSIDRSGSNFALQFDAHGYCGVGTCATGYSYPFGVPGVGALAFATQPGGIAVRGVALLRQPVVELHRDDGTLESGVGPDGTPITLTVKPGTGPPAPRRTGRSCSRRLSSFVVTTARARPRRPSTARW